MFYWKYFLCTDLRVFPKVNESRPGSAASKKPHPDHPRILANSDTTGGPGPTSHRSEEFPPQSAYLRWQVVDEQKAFGCPPNRGPLRDAVEGFSRVFPWVFPTKKVHIFVEDGGYGGTGSVVSPRFLAL